MCKISWTAEKADAAATAEKKAASAKYASKSCSRCEGQGFATAFSKTRSHWNGAGKKICFKCGGSGTVVASVADRVSLAKEVALIEVERLRRCWLAARDALRAAVETDKAASTWATAHNVRCAQEKLLRIETMGKAAKAAA